LVSGLSCREIMAIKEYLRTAAAWGQVTAPVSAPTLSASWQLSYECATRAHEPSLAEETRPWAPSWSGLTPGHRSPPVDEVPGGGSVLTFNTGPPPQA
jgi:hypothetical protein